MLPFARILQYGNTITDIGKFNGNSTKLISTITNGQTWCCAYDNNDTIYIYGGTSNGSNTGVINSLYTFSISTQVVTLVRSNFSSAPVANSGMCFYNNKLYIFGGTSSSLAFSYDVVSQTTTTLQSVPTSGPTSAILYNNKIIVITNNISYEYDTTTSSYITQYTIPFNVNTLSPSTAIMGDFLYSLSYSPERPNIDIYKTDLNSTHTNEKILTTTIPFSQYNYPALVNIMNGLYIFDSGYILQYINGGLTQMNISNASNLILPGYCVVKNTLYLFGGYRGSSRLNEIWLLT